MGPEDLGDEGPVGSEEMEGDGDGCEEELGLEVGVEGVETGHFWSGTESKGGEWG